MKRCIFSQSTTLLSAAAVALAMAAGLAAVSSAAPANPFVLTNSTYSPTHYTQEPLVGNGYLAQRVAAIGAGFVGGGTLGQGDWPLCDACSTTAMVAGVYETSSRSDCISTLPTWSDLSFGVGNHSPDPSVPTSQISGCQQALHMDIGTVDTSFTWKPTSTEPPRLGSRLHQTQGTSLDRLNGSSSS